MWNSFGIDGTGVVIGIIDTGADWQHDAIQRNWRGFNPDDPDNPVPYGNWLDCTGNSTLPADIINHGTHVTGTILGQDRCTRAVVSCRKYWQLSGIAPCLHHWTIPFIYPRRPAPGVLDNIRGQTGIVFWSQHVLSRSQQVGPGSAIAGHPNMMAIRSRIFPLPELLFALQFQVVDTVG